jgi:hypothetical protein
MRKKHARKTMATWKIDWAGQGVLVVAESWWGALLVVGKQFPFDAARDM